jgi:hypothetical protein
VVGWSWLGVSGRGHDGWQLWSSGVVVVGGCGGGGRMWVGVGGRRTWAVDECGMVVGGG